ncbi:hypothetical protein SAMN05444394_0868 [Algoriphagus halophilus]|uniref:Uncharacterized protein n=1 Tax=Algoriphagus halophilus TaxID=226505 RepID=A0A1N6DG88_9BACT|nr:hypothetical protein SAMN05444394_0868 [Algoriphagus halophilus]
MKGKSSLLSGRELFEMGDRDIQALLILVISYLIHLYDQVVESYF